MSAEGKQAMYGGKEREAMRRAIISSEDFRLIQDQARDFAKSRSPMGAIILNRHLSMLQALQDAKRITHVAVYRMAHYGLFPFVESKTENPDAMAMLPKSVQPIYRDMLSVIYLYALEYRKACEALKLNPPKDIPAAFWERAIARCAVVENADRAADGKNSTAKAKTKKKRGGK